MLQYSIGAGGTFAEFSTLIVFAAVWRNPAV